MAIAQMEAVANNPSQLKEAADQMKNMSESDLKQAVNQSPITSQQPPAAATTTTATNPAAMNNMSSSQFQRATQQMASMTPEQMKTQAAMLKSMPYDTLRKSNPQMANMTDAQIQMSIQQFEQMAANPEMMKMAADQMKNMDEAQFNSMKSMMGGGTGGSSGGGAAAAPSGGGMATENIALPTDPTKMAETLFSNPEQLNMAVKTMKQNPDMIKQMIMTQMGEGKSDAQKEQVNKAIDSFAQMDDVQLERYLKVANGVQRVASPFVGTFKKVKETLGVSTGTLVVMINLFLLTCLVGLARWWTLRNGDENNDDVSALDSMTREEPPEMAASYGDGEF